ncbi:MAG: lamin tail domain-containing protein, partial [Bacteroidia bacterium]
GMFVRFTSTNITNYYFDDIIVRQILADTIPPILNSVIISSPTKIVLEFSEPMDSSSLMNSNVSISNGINISSKNIRGNNFDSLELILNNTLLPNAFYSVSISHAKDLNQNQIVPYPAKNFIMLVPDTTETYDIVISEIMADPDPPIDLPDYEYVEIYNRSNRFISLKNWTIQDLTYKATFPDIILFPDSFLILTPISAKSFFQNFGTSVGLTSFPSLGNDGDTLVLKNEKGQVIHALIYSSEWYGDNVKKNGGWSLEMIDPKNPCSGKNNWTASKNISGGTPGKRNSVNGINRDVSPPQLVGVYLYKNKDLKLTFNESLDSTSISTISVNVNPFGNSSTVKLIPDFYNSFLCQFSDSFLTKNVYRVIVSGVKDCAGNIIGEIDFADFGLPEAFDSGEIVINEILFNPRSGGVDFVELYNRSDKVIDLKKLFIANTNPDNSINQLYQIAPSGFILFPKDYCALNENSEILKQQYFSPNTKNFIQCTMPSFPDNAGCAVIIDATGKRYDQFNYDDKIHLQLLDNSTGVSLERIDFNRPASDRTNWTSASTQVNATPAYRNSQFVSGNSNGEHLKVEPEVFSPDGDGYKDFANFSYSFDESGFTGNLFLYDARGVMVKQLLQNEILGTSGTSTWNGMTDKNEKAPFGIYLVYFEVFNLKGEVKNYRSTLVVGGKL